MAKPIQLTNKDYAKAVQRTVTIEVTIRPALRRWWLFRIWLAVRLARLAAWVGGTSFVLNKDDEA